MATWTTAWFSPIFQWTKTTRYPFPPYSPPPPTPFFPPESGGGGERANRSPAGGHVGGERSDDAGLLPNSWEEDVAATHVDRRGSVASSGGWKIP